MSPPTAAVVKFTKHKNTHPRSFLIIKLFDLTEKKTIANIIFPFHIFFFQQRYWSNNVWTIFLLIYILPTLRNPVVPPPPPFSPGIWKLTFWSIFFFLTIISRVVRHPDSGWTLSETGEEQAGLRHFMGQIRHLAGRRRSTERLQLSHVDRTGLAGKTTEEASEAF